MKKEIGWLFKIGLFLFLLFFVTGCDDNQNKLNDKAENEIDYLSSKLIYMENKLNNITFENYKMITEKVELTKDTEKQESESASSEQSQDNNSMQTSSENKVNTSITASQMSPNPISSAIKEPVDWKTLMQEMENVYYSWNTILIDLYTLNVNRESILAFSHGLDLATKSIQEENKTVALQEIASLYQFLPTYIKQISSQSEKYHTSQMRAHVLKAYSLVEVGDWQTIEEELQYAGDALENLKSNTSYASQKAYTINKSYILFNELKNSLSMEDKVIFYVKYRNLLEELKEL